MPVRATKRGPQRTRLERDCDVLICGASFAGACGRARARGQRAHVDVVVTSLWRRLRRARADRRPLRDRRAPDVGLRGADRVARGARPAGSIRQTFDELVVHTPLRTVRWPLPWTFSTFDYRELCALLCAQADSPQRRVRDGRRVTGRQRRHASTPTAASCARRSSSTRSAGAACSSNARADPAAQRARCRAASRSTRRRGEDLEMWIDPRYVRAATAGASPRATSCASASARSSPRPRQGADRRAGRRPRRCPPCATRATGSRTSCARRPRTACSSSATRPGTACR